ncbi:hypothetical protein [Thiohalophilus thiocyanatoxydans]|uniref:Uncharacterized protein n=1 Tax=Thiohalophilus thiocyanatoxydans TaxID=381308 RepID=A0A4R8IPH8_9GAMM|nr:hypothetical protein [Thiohalophilus thiocyanatoxydans]TDY02832.1 hypothetical protein EDC23_1216 [Thiohalophilus thiocyanatoxydans]
MDITDIMIHVHPDLSVEQRTKLEEAVAASDGVVSVHFSPQHQHELTVAYDPDATDSQSILRQVQQWDAQAAMAGL